MKMVRMLQSMAAERWTLMPGCEHPVRDDIAQAWDAAGIAIVLGDAVPGAVPLTREFGEGAKDDGAVSGDGLVTGTGGSAAQNPDEDTDPAGNPAPCGVSDNEGKAGDTDDPERGDPAGGRTGKPRGRKAAHPGGRK